MKRKCRPADLIVAAAGRVTLHARKQVLPFLRIVKRSIPKIASLSGPMLFIRHACLFYIHHVQFSYPPRTFVLGVKRRFGWSTIKKKEKKNKLTY